MILRLRLEGDVSMVVALFAFAGDCIFGNLDWEALGWDGWAFGIGKILAWRDVLGWNREVVRFVRDDDGQDGMVQSNVFKGRCVCYDTGSR